MLKKAFSKSVLKYLEIIPVLVWLAWIFVFSSEPFYVYSDPVAKGFWNVLKQDWQSMLFHVIEYAILAFLIVRGVLKLNYRFNFKKIMLWTFVFCVIYAFLDEFHQRFVPGRTPSLADILFDIIGAGIGIWLQNYFRYIFKYN